MQQYLRMIKPWRPLQGFQETDEGCAIHRGHRPESFLGGGGLAVVPEDGFFQAAGDEPGSEFADLLGKNRVARLGVGTISDIQ